MKSVFNAHKVTDPRLKALGQRIRELRLARHYSQESFADHCGVHRTFMGTVERGESNLSYTNLMKMANGLDLSLAKMLDGLDIKPPGSKPAAAKRPKPHA